MKTSLTNLSTSLERASVFERRSHDPPRKNTSSVARMRNRQLFLCYIQEASDVLQLCNCLGQVFCSPLSLLILDFGNWANKAISCSLWIFISLKRRVVVKISLARWKIFGLSQYQEGFRRFLGFCASVTELEETLQDGSHKIRKDGRSGIRKRLAGELGVAQRWRTIASE
jgi:hypothetical protein